SRAAHASCPGRARRRPSARALGLHARCGGASGKAEPVDLPDDRIARHAAKTVCDLACRKALGPQLLENVDAFIGPRHLLSPPSLAVLPSGKCDSESTRQPQTAFARNANAIRE